METRSHTYIVEGETPIAAMYQQYDGYIATFLKDRKVVHLVVTAFGERVFSGPPEELLTRLAQGVS